jgi:hypothetical protein
MQPPFLNHATMKKKPLMHNSLFSEQAQAHEYGGRDYVTKNIINYNKIWKTNLANNFYRSLQFWGSTLIVRVLTVH